MINNIYIIGCGGVGSWLAPSMCLLTSPGQVILVDGDTLETKNLNRQLFTVADLGRNKAEALAEKYGCRFEPRWFAQGVFELGSADWLMVCADNNPARAAALAEADTTGAAVIIAANETHSAEAYYYDDSFENQRDPRIYYPSITSDITGDPRAAAIGCTGLAQEQNRQLVSANFMAGALAQHLFVLWALEVPKLIEEDERFDTTKLPYLLRCNLSKLEYEPKPMVESPYSMVHDAVCFATQHKAVSWRDAYSKAVAVLGRTDTEEPISAPELTAAILEAYRNGPLF